MKIKIKINNEEKEFEKGITGAEIAKQEKIKGALAMIVEGKPRDLSEKIEKDCEIRFLTFEDPEGKEIFWHSSAHVLAQAVERLFPKAKLIYKK